MKHLFTSIFLIFFTSTLLAQNEGILIEAESGTLGSDFLNVNEGEVSYVTAATDFVAANNPGTDSKVITFSVSFSEIGNYDLYAKVRVGEGNFGDDSFFVGKGFGNKTSTTDADWYMVNGIANIGHSGYDEVVTVVGNAGGLVWKWINISEYMGGETPIIFEVSSTEESLVFQLGSRENGLDFDKIAFGKSDLFYTVENLENNEAGSETLPGETVYPEESYQLVKTYANPVLPGDHPDLTLLKVDDNFYTCNSSFHFTPYLAISHSTDLVHWKEISRVIPPDWPGLLSDAPKQGIWQGAITYFYGSYWIYFSNTAGGGQYFSKADTPQGPWSTPVKMNTTPETGASGYDNSVFVDDDGIPYMHIKPGRNTNRIQKIGPDGHLTGSVINLDWVNADNQYSWAEGPVMCKRDGWYYYFIAGNVGGGQYVLRSQSLTDDPSSWEALGDFFAPITDFQTPFKGPNHMSQPFQLEDGSWWTLSHSYENLSGDSWGGKGRQGLLHQIIWDENGKPTGLAPTTAPLVKPNLPKSEISWKLPRSDYFDSEELKVNWYFLNKSGAARYSLTDRSGWLSIIPGTGRSHILQKDAGHYYSLVTRVNVDATAEGQEGGVYLTNGNESVNIRLFSGYKGKKKIVFTFNNVTFEADNTIGNIVWLKLERKEHDLYGYYSADGVSWIQVGNSISAVDLDKNQENDNWWVGNSHGLYAQGTPADFDSYFYRDGASELPAAGYDNYFGIETSTKAVGEVVTNSTDKGGWLMLGGVELGAGFRKPEHVEVTASSQTGGSLEVWLDDLENEGILIATIPISDTGGEEEWEKFSADIADVSGQHDVYLRFSGPEEAFFISTIRFEPALILTDIKEGVVNNEGLSVYPNPFNESLFIDVKDRETTYEIYDLSGRKVEAGSLKRQGQPVGRNLLPAAYLLVVKTPRKSITVKIFKTHK